MQSQGAHAFRRRIWIETFDARRDGGFVTQKPSLVTMTSQFQFLGIVFFGASLGYFFKPRFFCSEMCPKPGVSHHLSKSPQENVPYCWHTSGPILSPSGSQKPRHSAFAHRRGHVTQDGQEMHHRAWHGIAALLPAAHRAIATDADEPGEVFIAQPVERLLGFELRGGQTMSCLP